MLAKFAVLIHFLLSQCHRVENCKISIYTTLYKPISTLIKHCQ